MSSWTPTKSASRCSSRRNHVRNSLPVTLKIYLLNLLPSRFLLLPRISPPLLPVNSIRCTAPTAPSPTGHVRQYQSTRGPRYPPSLLAHQLHDNPHHLRLRARLLLTPRLMRRLPTCISHMAMRSFLLPLRRHRHRPVLRRAPNLSIAQRPQRRVSLGQLVHAAVTVPRDVYCRGPRVPKFSWVPLSVAAVQRESELWRWVHRQWGGRCAGAGKYRGVG